MTHQIFFNNPSTCFFYRNPTLHKVGNISDHLGFAKALHFWEPTGREPHLPKPLAIAQPSTVRHQTRRIGRGELDPLKEGRARSLREGSSGWWIALDNRTCVQPGLMFFHIDEDRFAELFSSVRCITMRRPIVPIPSKATSAFGQQAMCQPAATRDWRLTI